ncbi:MAG: phosphoribosyl-AMP cyclohydrolase [Aggregatilineales bacterium]
MMKLPDTNTLEALNWNKDGLIPAIVQSADTGQVLMMAWMNHESLRQTLESSETVFWSRSRKTLWHKGETSGNIQKVMQISVDCDADTLLIEVVPAGAACHTGEDSCFYRTLNNFSENPIQE